MKMKNMRRRTSIMLLTLALFFMAFVSLSNGQTTANSSQSSESLSIVIHTFEEGGKDFVGYNIEMSVVNATSLPFNTSLLAFNDCFRAARFSVVGVGNTFSVFLRVSYSATLGISNTEAYADTVLGEFRKAFNVSLGFKEKTHIVNNETAIIDVYYELGDIERRIEPFEELTKYKPIDGFGQLVTRDLLSFYLRNDFIPNTFVNQVGFDHIEYNLTRIDDQTLVWQFSLEVAFQESYQNEGHRDVSLNELLRHSGPITLSTNRHSQAHLYVWKKEFTSQDSPLWMSFNSSSSPYTDLKENSDTIAVTYNLTDPVDNIVVRINIARESGLNLIYATIIIVVAAFATSFGVFVFAKIRRKKLQEVKSGENPK